jgi:hypothetical protein
MGYEQVEAPHVVHFPPVFSGELPNFPITQISGLFEVRLQSCHEIAASIRG